MDDPVERPHDNEWNNGGNMRDYQRQKNNKYILPSAVYHQTLWTIRDYYRIRQEADDILTEASAQLDGMPKGNRNVDVVTKKAIRRENLLAKITAIEGALLEIPFEYRKPIWNNIMYGTPFPIHADRSTYGRNKSKFIAGAAERLGIYENQ